MYEYWKLLFLPLTTAFIVVYLSTPYVIRFANKFGLIDDPKKNKHPKVIHTYPVPRAGGLALFAGILIASFIFLPKDKHLLGIILGSFSLVTMGVVDDKYNLNPYLRLAIQFATAAIQKVFGSYQIFSHFFGS